MLSNGPGFLLLPIFHCIVHDLFLCITAFSLSLLFRSSDIHVASSPGEDVFFCFVLCFFSKVNYNKFHKPSCYRTCSVDVLQGLAINRVKESSIKILVIMVLLVLEINFDVIFTFYNFPVLLQVAAMGISSPSCLQLLLWHLTRHVDADQVQNISHMGIIHFKVILIQL